MRLDPLRETLVAASEPTATLTVVVAPCEAFVLAMEPAGVLVDRVYDPLMHAMRWRREVGDGSSVLWPYLLPLPIFIVVDQVIATDLLISFPGGANQAASIRIQWGGLAASDTVPRTGTLDLADQWNPSGTFTVTGTPGTYSVRVVAELADGRVVHQDSTHTVNP